MEKGLKFEPLDSYYVERGSVKKCLLFQQGFFSVAILELSPGAKIRKHRHNVDNEKYVFENGESSTCTKGYEHELENTTDKTIRVYSIKWS